MFNKIFFYLIFDKVIVLDFFTSYFRKFLLLLLKMDVYQRLLKFQPNTLEQALVTELLTNTSLSDPKHIIYLILISHDFNTFLRHFGSFSQDLRIKLSFPVFNLDYTVIDMNQNYALILNYHKLTKSYCLSLHFYDLLVIDIDNQSLESVERRILESQYSKDLFACHETSREHYHLILLSRPASYYSKDAINLNLLLNGDPNYCQISMYRGISIRIIGKSSDRYMYQKVKMIGRGVMNTRVEGLYKNLMSYVDEYGCYNFNSFENDINFRYKLYQMWEMYLNDNISKIGMMSIFDSCPSFLIESDNNIVYSTLIQKETSNTKQYRQFFVNKIVKEDKLDCYFGMLNNTVRDNNCYQLLENSVKYAVGIDLSSVTYFIVFRDLLMIDYDYKNRLQILGHFCRQHPEYCFRVISSRNGYHAFCTSRILPYNSEEAKLLLFRLRSDPMHILASLKKGYSARLNRKVVNEKEKKWFKLGKGVELQEQIDLVQKFLELAKQYSQLDCPLIKQNRHNAAEIITNQE